ncbi:MAG: TonB-dependent receptor [Desulfobacteraceae bacterium]
MHHLTFFLIFFLLILQVRFAEAGDEAKTQDDENPVYRMEDVVVTAPGPEDEIIDGPASLTIITREDIEKTAARDIDDLLKHMAGVQVLQPWGIFGPDSKTSMRGFSQSRTTVFLKDGLPLNRVICGGAKSDEFSLEMVEKIMLARGMSASVGGVSAMAGIINIEGKVPGDKTEAYVKARYGTYNTRSGDVSFSTRLTDKWGFLFGYHHFDTDGYPSWSSQWVDEKIEEWSQLDHKGQNTITGFLEAINDNQIRKTDALTGRLVFTPAESTTLSLESSYWSNNVHNSMKDNDNYQKRHRTTMTLKYQDHIDFNAGFSYLKEDFSFNRPITPKPDSFNLADSRYYYRVRGQESRIPLVDYAGAANVSLFLGNRHRLMLAANLRYGTIANEIKSREAAVNALRKSDVMQGKQISGGVTALDEITFGKIDLTLSVEYERIRFFDTFYEDKSILEEYEERFDEQINPKLGVLYHLNKSLSFRGSISRSSNFPTLMNLFGIFEQPPGRERIGNPLLKTENAIGYEAGLEYRRSEKIMFGMTAYYNGLYDWIESTEARADLPDQDLKENTVLWQNVDRAMTAGLETEVRWSPFKGLQLFVNYAYTKTRIDRFDEASVRYKYFIRTTTHNKEKEGNQLSGQPLHSANAGLFYRHPHLADLSVSWHFMGERYYDVENTLLLESYISVDLKLSRSFGRYIQTSVTVNNLFDAQWQDDDQHRPPGRMVWLGVKAGF